jgi:hypothetical protein
MGKRYDFQAIHFTTGCKVPSFEEDEDPHPLFKAMRADVTAAGLALLGCLASAQVTSTTLTDIPLHPGPDEYLRVREHLMHADFAR